LRDRFERVVIVALLALLAAVAAEPYLRSIFFSAESRTVAPRADLSEAERSTIELFQRVSPSVVQIVAVPRGLDQAEMMGRPGAGVQSGTGFVWDGAGHIVTNNHVVSGADLVSVRMANGDVVGAEVLGLAPNYDLAVLRLRSTASLPAPVAVGRSADLQVGQAAFAIGNPFGLDQSLSTGVISALSRRLPTEGGREITDVVQTDTAINPGNSGGPLLDSAGRVIGVNTAIYSPSGANAGIGFAIPIDTVNRVVPELIRTGRVPTPGIGIVAADEAVTTRMGVAGVIVVRTEPGSPADQAGLRGVDPRSGELGDVIVGINGKPVRRLADLTGELEIVGVGKEVELQVRRGVRTVDLDVAVTDVARR
jgi:S1-C subfamily serine protease